jgi:hypothetical protein
MNTKGSRFEDFPKELQDRVKRQIVDTVAKHPVKVRLPYYFNKRGGKL